MCPARPINSSGRCCKAHTFLVGTTSCQHCDKTLTADVGWLAGHATVCGQSVGLLTDVCTGGNPSLNQSLSSPSSSACAGCEGCGETQAKKIFSCDPCDDPGVGQRPWGPQEMCGPSGSLGETLVRRLAPPSAHPPPMQTPGIPCPVSPAPPSTSQVYLNLVFQICLKFTLKPWQT